MIATGSNALRLAVLLLAIEGAAALPVLADNVASSTDRDVNAALTDHVAEVAQTDHYSTCAVGLSDTAGAIDCEVNTELSRARRRGDDCAFGREPQKPDRRNCNGDLGVVPP